jgi:hypothetical protein
MRWHGEAESTIRADFVLKVMQKDRLSATVSFQEVRKDSTQVRKDSVLQQRLWGEFYHQAFWRKKDTLGQLLHDEVLKLLYDNRNLADKLFAEIKEDVSKQDIVGVDSNIAGPGNDLGDLQDLG